MAVVDCPICNQPVKPADINSHIDSDCTSFVNKDPSPPPQSQNVSSSSQPQKRTASSFFSTPAPKRAQTRDAHLTPVANRTLAPAAGKKRSFDEGPGAVTSGPGGGGTTVEREERIDKAATKQRHETADDDDDDDADNNKEDDGLGADGRRTAKRLKTLRAAPLAERMRPQTLDEVCGQELVGPRGVLRALIESRRVPSMILWGASGTGKTTIARCIAQVVGSRFVELNATSSGVAECKRLFHEAAGDLALTGRKTIVFCDEMHRFNKAQQDVFLKPVEAGTVTLVGATTENPSFRIAAALLSRCRTFTLQPLSADDVAAILRRARAAEGASPDGLVDDAMLDYLARFSDGDARTALNLLELALPR
ncbi:ATPase family associated with various cellular activities (AAA) domain-containing protein [Hirsutella rhossiliensis]|uniref:ATPase family associated with various cellular activities (AAA) domain-containing protein n=1 Tax=Hirsutella rhossiliensis TaxID=111463 RepID=A0A9P8N791_9HYPO|nr:ATPase family associated with various cellular activities (AAA) domain-containing protein [Hirsutella rhossiliensis]KAH0968250.1 ATPase family associated with various cellular activities (AAA) domain-containing protein [Hirsutella rhossiliensis]